MSGKEQALSIFIVDDEPPARNRLRDVLNDCSEKLPLKIVGEASNGSEALEKIKAGRFSLVLSDVDMPDMNGEELVKAIRSDLSLETPVIAITAFAIMGDREKLLLSGFTDYVSKPVELDRLKEVMDRYVL